MQTQHGRVLGACRLHSCFERAERLRITGPQIWKLRSREKREWCCEELGVACEASELFQTFVSVLQSHFESLHISYNLFRKLWHSQKCWNQTLKANAFSRKTFIAMLPCETTNVPGALGGPKSLADQLLWCFFRQLWSEGWGWWFTTLRILPLGTHFYEICLDRTTKLNHQHPPLDSENFISCGARSLAKKKFCCKTKGVACKVQIGMVEF